MDEFNLVIVGDINEDGTELVVMHVMSGSLVIEGPTAMDDLATLMRTHDAKAKADPVLFLFFARRWFTTRGYKPRFIVDENENWLVHLIMHVLEKTASFRLATASSVDEAFNL